MEFMTLKQYAASRGISYEAVRRQVNKYKKELADHIVRKDGVQYLDQDAIAFLSEKRRRSPLVIVHEDNKDKIDQLEEELRSVKEKLLAAQTEILNAQRKVIEMQDAMKDSLEAKARYDLLLEDHQRTEEELAQLKAELADAQKEAGSYRRTWFGLYKKTDTV